MKFVFFQIGFMENKRLRFLFVTANRNESEALRESGIIEWKKEQVVLDSPIFYHIGNIKCTDHLVVHFQLLEQGSGGVDASLISVDSAIKQWRPDAVICLGIAFGKGGDQEIGDILVSSRIINFGRAKITENHHILKSEQPASGSALRCIMAEYAGEWTLQNPNRVFLGPMLCSDLVIDSSEYKKKLFQNFPEAIGGEMEANGIYAACKRNNIEEWIIIKAICDWGENKQANKKENQIKASKSVVSFVDYVFSKTQTFELLKNNNQPSQNKITSSSAPIGYLINIGTTSCRLFEVVGNISRQIKIVSYDNCDTTDNSYLESIIVGVRILLNESGINRDRERGVFRKVFADYKFEEIFENRYGDRAAAELKDFTLLFYKETNLYFNILTKEKTIENIKRLFGTTIKKNTAILSIGKDFLDIVFHSSNEEFYTYTLPVTIDDIKRYVQERIRNTIWSEEDVKKAKEYIYSKIGKGLDDIKVDQTIILKEELNFMRDMKYNLRQCGNQFVIDQNQYRKCNREFLFSRDFEGYLKEKYRGEDTRIERLSGFRYGHLLIEAILEKVGNKTLIPKNFLSIHGSLNAYVFNVVISGTTQGNRGMEYLYEANKMLEKIGVTVLSPQFDDDGKLLKDVSADTECDHLKAIDDCDVLFVCNKSRNGYIGTSTKCEIYYAYALKKTIAFWQEPTFEEGEDTHKLLSFIPIEVWSNI
jgi:purine or other phosphorylase family 1